MTENSLDAVLASDLTVDAEVNERAAFYLTNKTLIDTWASLRDEASLAIQEVVYSLADQLAEDLRALGATDPQVTTEGGRYPAIHLSSPTWADESGHPPVMIGLEWNKGTIRSDGSLGIYACVIAPLSHPGAKAHEPAITQLSRSVLAALGREAKSNLPRWPVYEYLAAPTSSWDPGEIATASRAAALRLWVSAAPHIDRMLNQPNSDKVTG